MTAGRGRVAFRTLRSKIVAITLALLVASFLVVGLVTALAMHTFLVARLDQQLTEAGVRFSVSLEHPDNDGDADDPSQFQSVAGQAAGTLGARIVNKQVTVAAVVGRNDTSATPSAEARAVIARLTVTSHPRDLTLPDLDEYRVIVSKGADGDLLVTGLPLRPVRDTIARLLLVEAVVFGGALLVVGFVSTGVIRFALRPLDRVAAVASEVAQLPLASGVVSLPERVPAPGSGDREVGQVAAAFNHMLEEVESALTQRQASEDRLRHFIADASHELRTPVAVVRSHAEYARRTGGTLPDEVDRSLSRIQSEADRMGHLVDDLLLLARLDSGRPLAREHVDLTRLVLDSVSDARIAGPGQFWRLALDEEPVTVTGDDLALRQVLSNLLANVRAHTPDGTTVITALHADPSGGAHLTVTDDGPGIAPEMLSRVFERFVHGADARSAASSSSGLGLSIVAAIVAAHGGTATVESRPGRTRFGVALPAEPAPRMPDVAAAAEDDRQPTVGAE